MCTQPRKIPAREDSAANSRRKHRQRLRYPCSERVQLAVFRRGARHGFVRLWPCFGAQ